MRKNSFLKAFFSGPKFSLSPIEKTNKGTTRIGEVIPVYKTMLQGRETLELDLGHLVRFSPTVVPVMEGYEVNFDAFCVPVSALAYAQRKERDIMDFHNLALNDGEEVNPFCVKLNAISTIKYGADNAKLSDFFRPSSLGDYLNLPSFKNFRDFVRRWISQSGLLEGGLYNKYADDEDLPSESSMSDIFDFVARVHLNSYSDDVMIIDGSGRSYGVRYYAANVPFPANDALLSGWCSIPYDSLDSLLNTNYYGDFRYQQANFDDNSAATIQFTTAISFVRYLLVNYPLLASYYGFSIEDDPTDLFNHLALMRENGGLDLNYLDKLYEFYKIDAQSAFDEYFNYIMSQVLYNKSLHKTGANNGKTLWFENEVLPDIFVDDIDTTYFAAYWKIISDWYINTNIDGDPNDFYVSKAGACLLSQYDSESESDLIATLGFDLKPFNRRYPNDPFTSAVPSSAVTNVLIPADGTIPDLREANAFQKLVDILRNTGKRLRDVQYGIRGYRPTADSTDMSQPLGSLHSFVGIQSVLQTSATSKDSALASYAGIGTDSSRGDFKRILKVVNNNEATPVVVMVLMSITQRASYFQGMPRYFYKRKSIYDFAIPQLANIGEQEIMTKEIFCDYNNGSDVPYSEVFGFNRRYYDWFFEDNEIHGNMRDSEDMWHSARVFGSKPALNSEFIEINSEKDDINRIFANISPVAQPIYYNVTFVGQKVVALPRYIQYDL